ncbi:hypothetical protein [Flavobacterium sp.]|uniref:hypothetical protein n=1 Tax=Flavobacterium sp. TaxID=239 RepID=UPI003751A9FB
MNDAHLHMVVNHFPIIGTLLGLGILFAGLVLKNNTIKNVAYCLFIVSAIFAFASMNTGEGAEELVEDMPNIGKKIIHEHEEVAEKLALSLYLLGFVSIAGLYSNTKNKFNAKLVSFIALTIAMVAVFLAQQTGTSGGEIRHTEIRKNAITDTLNAEEHLENVEEVED